MAKDKIKKKLDVGKLIGRILAAILALMMVVGVAGTLIYYLATM